MTTKLEQEFFNTFGIEPKYKTCIFKYCKSKKEYDCDNCDDREWHYSEITSEKLLEMICTYNCFQNDTNSFFIPFDYKSIKNNILEFLIEKTKDKYKNKYFSNNVEKLKYQIEQLFNET